MHIKMLSINALHASKAEGELIFCCLPCLSDVLNGEQLTTSVNSDCQNYNQRDT
jgi:hypothetical protein